MRHATPIACALLFLATPAIAAETADAFLAEAPPPHAAPRGNGGLIYAGRVWTDADADGLADCGPANPFAAAEGELVTFDLWIDPGEYVAYNFELWTGWDPACFEYMSAEYIVAGGTTSPPEIRDYRASVGLFGFGFAIADAQPIARITLRALTAASCCAAPLLDPSDWDETWCQIWEGDGTWVWFREVGASCFEPGGAGR